MAKIDAWRQRIAERNASGLTVKEWCIQNDVPKEQYYYWSRRIRISDGNKNEKEVVFAEVKMEPKAVAHSDSTLCGSLQVSWNGFQMQIRNSGDARLAAEFFAHLQNLC